MAIFLHLPLENKLSDGFVWNASSILLRRVELATSTSTKKNRQPQGLSVLFWSKCGDSNSRPPVPETGALPTALHLEIIV